MKKLNSIVNYSICLFILVLSTFFLIPAVYSQPVPTPTPVKYDNSLNILIDLMNIFLNVNFSNGSGTITPVLSPSPTLQPRATGTASGDAQQNPASTINPLSSNFVYYAQCGGNYDNITLPNGCNLCQSGCGPTTISMILSSYIDKKFSPDAVVSLYKQNGFFAGCDGTRIADAMDILLQNGLRTTSLMLYDNNINAIQDFKTYINDGWTFLVVARFCSNGDGCPHFFWITDIDENNNVWAYDPYYGRKALPPPYNESSRYPFPQYRMAFGVKK